MFMDIICIDLFDQNVGMAYAEVRFRCSWKSLVLICLPFSYMFSEFKDMLQL